MIINNQNITTYKRILANARPRYQIYKYMLKRLLGVDAKFTKNVYIRDGTHWLNCGRIMENCKVAADNFESKVKQVIDEQDKGTFIDIGAHIGKHSLYAFSKGYDTISIEADEDTFRLLEDNMGNMGLKINVALSDKKEKIIFNKSELHPATSSMIVRREGAEKIELQANTLDNVLSGTKINAPILMKIDVEGAELKVLRGATNFIKKYHPDIIYEAWSENQALRVGIFLAKFGYSIDQLDNEFNWIARRTR